MWPQSICLRENGVPAFTKHVTKQVSVSACTTLLYHIYYIDLFPWIQMHESSNKWAGAWGLWAENGMHTFCTVLGHVANAESQESWRETHWNHSVIMNELTDDVSSVVLCCVVLCCVVLCCVVLCCVVLCCVVLCCVVLCCVVFLILHEVCTVSFSGNSGCVAHLSLHILNAIENWFAKYAYQVDVWKARRRSRTCRQTATPVSACSYIMHFFKINSEHLIEYIVHLPLLSPLLCLLLLLLLQWGLWSWRDTWSNWVAIFVHRPPRLSGWLLKIAVWLLESFLGPLILERIWRKQGIIQALRETQINEQATFTPIWPHPAPDLQAINIESLNPAGRAAVAAHTVPGDFSTTICFWFLILYSSYSSSDSILWELYFRYLIVRWYRTLALPLLSVLSYWALELLSSNCSIRLPSTETWFLEHW